MEGSEEKELLQVSYIIWYYMCLYIYIYNEGKYLKERIELYSLPMNILRFIEQLWYISWSPGVVQQL